MLTQAKPLTLNRLRCDAAEIIASTEIDLAIAFPIEQQAK